MSASEFRSEHPPGAIRVVHESEHIVAVCLEGDFDRTNVSHLDLQIQQTLDRGHDLILDLSQATFIDSSIVGLMIRASQSADRREQTMILQLGTAPMVERVLELLRIDQLIRRVHNREEAVRTIEEQARTPWLRPL